MELTIFSLVCITFIAGVVGGLVIAEEFDLEQTNKRRKRKARREARRQAHRREANRRMDKIRKMPTFTIDKF